MWALHAWQTAPRQQVQQLLLPLAVETFNNIRQLHSCWPLPATEQPKDGPLPTVYNTHVRLHPLQKSAVALFGALGALARPARGDLVAVVGETFGDAALRAMAARMRSSPAGREILEQRPRVTDAAVARCWDLPPDTFGGAYAAFMGERGFSADERPVTRLVEDEELAYVVTRAREVHDFWHVLFGCDTNVFGEIALKALEFVQTGLPMPAMAVAGAQFRLSPEDRVLLWQTYLPWATRAGMRSADLMCLYYERHLDEPLDELRRRWRIEPAPQPPPRLIRRRRNSSSSSSSSSSSANGTDEGKLATASVGETRRQ